MRILLLCGSPRKDGNSSAMADAFTYGAKDAGHTVVRFETAYINVNSCIGCRNCWADGRRCVLPADDMDKIYAEFEQCEAIVFASPVYWYSFTAQLKTVMDRFGPYTGSPEGRQRSKIRYCALLGCAEAESHEIFTGMLFGYRGMAQYLGWKDCGSVVVPNVCQKGEILNTNGLDHAYTLGLNIGK